MVIPIGGRFDQVVHLITKKDGKLTDRQLRPTLFVPMTGRAQREAAEERKAKKAK
jgi:protein-L-isoaspartate(D-aspartate) O-methyltransferase